MTTVIDFGPVDWGKIWGDRATLVSSAHLTDLNSISNATHLSSPGYWRNLFSSYPEVISNQGFIAQHYVLPGREPSRKTTTQEKPMLSTQAMNVAVTAKNTLAREEHNLFLSKKPPDMFHQTLYSIGRDTGVTAAGEKVVAVVNKVGDTASKVGSTVENLVNAANNAASNLNDLSSNTSTIYLIGAILVGSIIYSNVK